MAATRFILVALFLAFISVSFAAPNSRILGGENAAVTDVPYAASIRLDNAHLCGGSIISTRHILTAAHCVTEQSSIKAVDVRRLSARVGSSNQFAGGKVVFIKGVTIHPQYTDIKNDLAILTLTQELVWTPKIRSIVYAKTAEQLPPEDAAVITAGWGEDDSGIQPYKLQHSTLKVASEGVCTNAYNDNDDSVICLAHETKKGSCKGDAGNGAVYESNLVAVSSFVIGACGSRYPDVFVNIAYFANWIDSVLSMN